MKKSILVLSSLLVGASALADTSTQTSVAQPAAAQVAAEPAWYEKLKIQNVTIFDGPPIGAMDSHYRSNPKTGYIEEGDVVGLRNDLGVFYPLTKSATLGPVTRFRVKTYAEGSGALIDPYIRLRDTKFAEIAGVNMDSQLRFGLPLSDSSKAKEQNLYVANLNNFTYSIPETKWTLGTITFVKANFFETGGARNPKGIQNDLEMFILPNVSYQVLSNVSLELGYEADANHAVGQSFMEFNNGGTFIEPGLSWDISKSVTFNPWVDIYLGDRVASDTTMVGAKLVWTIM